MCAAPDPFLRVPPDFEVVLRRHRLEREVMAALTEREQRTLLSLVARLQAHVRELAPDVEFRTPM